MLLIYPSRTGHLGLEILCKSSKFLVKIICVYLFCWRLIWLIDWFEALFLMYHRLASNPLYNWRLLLTSDPLASTFFLTCRRGMVYVMLEVEARPLSMLGNNCTNGATNPASVADRILTHVHKAIFTGSVPCLFRNKQ